MNTAELLADGFSRVQETVHAAVAGLSAEELSARLDDEANSVGWLIWHLTRVQDDHVAEVTGTEQIWTGAGWKARFGLPFAAGATGYGDTPAEVAAVQVDAPSLLTGYYDAVHEHTLDHVRGLSDADLDRVVDERWNPPVTLGVRLISVISDDLQHAGQAAFLRGLLVRRRR